jgi:hypothetical protein
MASADGFGPRRMCYAYDFIERFKSGICERLGVQLPGPTRPRGDIPRAYSPAGRQNRKDKLRHG